MQKQIISSFQNRDEFFNVLKRNPGLVIVKLGATWCGPCKQIGPVLDQLAAEMNGAVLITKVDVDTNQALAQQLGVNSIPALFLFKNGVVVDKIVGARPKGDIATFIKKHL